MAAITPAYPAALDIDYPERPDRLTTLLRIFTVIPIFIILGLISGPSGGATPDTDAGLRYQYAAGGILFLPTLLMILFRLKYPRWWFDWNYNLTKFSYRVGAYFLLLMHQYPSTDEDQAVHLDLAYPNVPVELNRWLPLVKWFLAIPHYIVLFFLGIAALVVTVIAWFAILITGTYPRGLFDFVVGVGRWGLRVSAYAILLITDRYPPFSLS